MQPTTLLSVLVLSKLHAVPTLPFCPYHPKSQLCNAYVLDAGRWLKTMEGDLAEQLSVEMGWFCMLRLGGYMLLKCGISS